MKCSRHPSHDGIGVCATCLHERLLDFAGNRSSSSRPSPPGSLLSLSRSVSSTTGSRRPSILSVLIGRSRSGVDRDSGSRRSSPWLSMIRHGRRLKSASLPSSSDDAAAVRRARGMSPERRGHPAIRRATTEHHRHRSSAFTGLAICFGPLVTASPSRRRSRVTEQGCSGESQGTAVGPRHLRAITGGGEPELRHGHSWKLADIGKFK